LSPDYPVSAPTNPAWRCVIWSFALPTAVLSGGIAREALEHAGAAAVYAGPLEVAVHLEEFSHLQRL